MDVTPKFQLPVAILCTVILGSCDKSVSPTGPGPVPVVATANVENQPCTEADALATFESWSAVINQVRRGHDQSSRVDAFARCQYRLFQDGRTFTFKSGEVFLGGANVNWDYETLDALGATREEAIANLEANETRVWLVPILTGGGLGTPVEQHLIRTPYKDGTIVNLGRVLQQHRAFWTTLPPGEYLSVFSSRSEAFFTFPAEDFLATVHLVIIP